MATDLGMTTLDIPLRGRRDYVHSTDLFAALGRLAEAQLSSEAWLRKLVLRKAAFHQVEAHFTAKDSAFGTFELRNRDQTTAGWLVESDRSIERRIAFDEAPVRDAAIAQLGRVSLSTPIKGYTSFEQMIVLLKLLGAQLHAGAWLLTAIDLSTRFHEHLPLEVVLQQTILNRGADVQLCQNRQSIGRTQIVLSRLTGDTQ